MGDGGIFISRGEELIDTRFRSTDVTCEAKVR